jgi:hypothetical protein
LKNETKAKQEFEQRIKETKIKAIQENIKMAEKSGNKLTQTLDEQGNLVGVRETVNFEEREAADTDTTNIRNELLKESIQRSKDEQS